MEGNIGTGMVRDKRGPQIWNAFSMLLIESSVPLSRMEKHDQGSAFKVHRKTVPETLVQNMAINKLKS